MLFLRRVCCSSEAFGYPFDPGSDPTSHCWGSPLRGDPETTCYSYRRERLAASEGASESTNSETDCGSEEDTHSHPRIPLIGSGVIFKQLWAADGHTY